MGSRSENVSPEYVEWATGAVGKWEVGKDWLIRKGAWEVFDHCVLGRRYPTATELPALCVGLAYAAKRMGY